MNVEIWSDIVCPWCYIGKRNFEAALAEFEHRDDVTVTWRSFELDPSAPLRREGDMATRIARKYGLEIGEARARLAHMTSAAANVGIDFRFDLVQAGNTFDGHRLVHLGADHGIQDAVKERLLRATFTEGRKIGERDTLLELAVDAGLDEMEAKAVLEGDAYAARVRADEAQAEVFDIAAVPFFVIDRTYGLSGAQPPRILLKMLNRAWDDKQTEPQILLNDSSTPPGPTCDDDVCTI